MAITAQEQRQQINGLVKHNSNGLQFINIQNLATEKGTVSNTNGNFFINVKKGDSLLFSSLVYKNRTIKITENHISANKIEVYLEAGVNQLEEVFLKSYAKPNFNDVALPKGAVLKNDNIDKIQAPNIAKKVDPVKSYGINFIGVVQNLLKGIRQKRKEKKNKLSEIEHKKKQIPYLIKDKFGEELFTNTLHIEKDKIEIFLDYCKDNGLGKFYESPDIEIINFMVIQSKKFNKINN